MKRLFSTLFIVMFVVVCYSQTTPKSDEFLNYYDFLIDFYTDNESENPENFFTKRVERSKRTWAAKLYPDGDVNRMARAYFDYYEEFHKRTIVSSTVSWTCLGPTGMPAGSSSAKGNGRIHRLTFDPQYNGTTNKTIYATTSFGGLWKTIDDGANWLVLNTDTQLPSNAVSDVAIGHNNSNNIFISTGWADASLVTQVNPNRATVNPYYTHGIYRSIDGGQNWVPINNGFEQYFSTEAVTTRRIVVSPANDNIVLFATSEGLFRTNNALSTAPFWLRVNDDCDFRGVEFKPGNSNVVYASGTEIYRSTDAGSTWVPISSMYGLDYSALPESFTPTRINIAVTNHDPERLYAVMRF
jgi:hypothetical protein